MPLEVNKENRTIINWDGTYISNIVSLIISLTPFYFKDWDVSDSFLNFDILLCFLKVQI